MYLHPLLLPFVLSSSPTSLPSSFVFLLTPSLLFIFFSFSSITLLCTLFYSACLTRA